MTNDRREEIVAYLEIGTKRIFAGAFDWPGWCRSGKDEEKALAALAAAAPRYAAVAREAGLAFPSTSNFDFQIVERLPGSMTTDFGAPASVAARDYEPLTREDAERLAALLTAAWTIFDRIVAAAPAELRKGPRGGGRDRDKVIQHVLGVEAVYGRKIGVRQREPSIDDRVAIVELRDAILQRLRSASETPVDDRGWPPRYLARRLAWHVLDHAWEIEDRAEG